MTQGQWTPPSKGFGLGEINQGNARGPKCDSRDFRVRDLEGFGHGPEEKQGNSCNEDSPLVP